ncbi:alpha/beta hydrolase [Ascidiimonas aurantiaca]|uniref:alpha/beta hydrolase n=1 Tax=Ascidiimonas aurantiaca TaxID=1685432 RepID=UPI0030EEF3A2
MQAKDLSLTHTIRSPKTASENAPALILLHGYGSNEEDLFSFASYLPDKLFIISVRAPYELMPSGYAWYAIHFDAHDGKWSDDKQALVSRDAIVQFIDEAVEAYDLDANNISLLGFSQGTVLSFSVALSFPEKVKQVIALSGYINEKLIAFPSQNDAYAHLSIYVSHGSVDQVIPVEWARKTAPFLEKHGIDHVYEEFPVGHGVAPDNFNSFLKWLLSKL